jgi:hypothetical protein
MGSLRPTRLATLFMGILLLPVMLRTEAEVARARTDLDAADTVLAAAQAATWVRVPEAGVLTAVLVARRCARDRCWRA